MVRVAQAERAILLASPASDVRQHLMRRAKKASFSDPLDAAAEGELLDRDERLIDLTLAEYCLRRETAKRLLDRNPGDWPIRALVLSNTALAGAQLGRGFPECLFETKEEITAFLRGMSSDERSVLFRNPTLEESFLEAFLSMGWVWDAVDDAQRLHVISDLAFNPRMRRARDSQHFDEGWDWYMAGKPFSAAWSLIERLEPTPDAALKLSALLRNIPADSYAIEGIEEALNRWSTPVGEVSEKEQADNSKWRLSDYQEVRQAGARLLASHHTFDAQALLDSDDLAIRCGAYEAARNLGETEIKGAIERDGDHARTHLVCNDRFWRTEKLRDRLLDEVLRGASSDEPRWEYRRMETRLRSEHPEWFKDEGYVEPDDRPLTESSVSEVAQRIASDLPIGRLADRITALERSVGTLTWIAVAIAVLLGILLWR